MAKDQTQVFVRKNFDGGIVIQQHETELPTLEARIALSLMEKWALVAADTEGEDSAGRAKLRRLSADEVAQYSCDVAQKAMEQFRSRGWLKEVPTAHELVDRLKAEGGKNDDKVQLV